VGESYNSKDIGTGEQRVALHQGKLVSSGSNRGIQIINKSNLSSSISVNSRLDVFHYGVTT
jgi:hypothetical protein